MPIKQECSKDTYKKIRSRIRSAVYAGSVVVLPDQYDGYSLQQLMSLVRETPERPKGRKGSHLTRVADAATSIRLCADLTSYYEALRSDLVWTPPALHGHEVKPASIVVYSKSPAWWVYEAKPVSSPVRNSIFAGYGDKVRVPDQTLDDPTLRPIDTNAFEILETVMLGGRMTPFALVQELTERGINGMREFLHFERAGVIKIDDDGLVEFAPE